METLHFPPLTPEWTKTGFSGGKPHRAIQSQVPARGVTPQACNFLGEVWKPALCTAVVHVDPHAFEITKAVPLEGAAGDSVNRRPWGLVHARQTHGMNGNSSQGHSQTTSKLSSHREKVYLFLYLFTDDGYELLSFLTHFKYGY